VGVYLPVAAVVAAWVAETMRISWFAAPIAIVVVIAAVGGAVLFLHDPLVCGAASSLIVALSVSLTASSAPFNPKSLSTGCCRTGDLPPPVHFIAGPDLAGASIEPEEFFAFMRGQLADRFVRTAPEMTAAVDRLDRERDPDGRFRVNELFCAEDTWRETVRMLMAHAGVVLLDLPRRIPKRVQPVSAWASHLRCPC
jgi:hypothetical protein